MSQLTGVHLLNQKHYIDDFDCGVISLNEYLKKYALQNQLSHGARTYVATREEIVVGYFTLAYGSISPEYAPNRLKQGLGGYHIPTLILARLAIDKMEKGKGLGKALLKQALKKALYASELAGLRAVLVNAKDANSKNYYEKFGFQSFPLDELTLFLLIKDIQKSFNAERVKNLEPMVI